VIPLPIILVEFLLAFGAALLVAQAVAIVRLRREDNWPPTRPAGTTSGPAGPAAARPGGGVPSRSRILTQLVIGLAVSLWALSTLVALANRGSL
jgi:hypothetical protein